MDEADFVSFLDRTASKVLQEQQSALHSGADIVLGEVREIIGNYQRDELGGQEEWAELAPRTKSERVDQGYTENDPGLRDGTMKRSYATEVEYNKFTVGSPMLIAKDFELGTAKQPPRPITAIALFRKAPEVTKLVAQHITEALKVG